MEEAKEPKIGALLLVIVWVERFNSPEWKNTAAYSCKSSAYHMYVVPNSARMRNEPIIMLVARGKLIWTG
jgi:hypothetical protein